MNFSLWRFHPNPNDQVVLYLLVLPNTEDPFNRKLKSIK